MKNYRKQNSCRNCKHVFILQEYDDHDTLFCTLSAPKRPLCGSVYMKETIYQQYDSIEDRAWNIYCDETKDGMDVKDYWFELTEEIQDLYLDKAIKQEYEGGAEIKDVFDKWANDRYISEQGICDAWGKNSA